MEVETFSRDGGIGRYTLLPHVTAKELQLNLNAQNCQKIKVYGSLTTKDLKKPHLSRWVGGQRHREARRSGVARRGSGKGSPTFTCG